ncbi:hypothetical protein, partial [Flavobacterium sp.]|uniref:hypothetical protein n=1 Tax=Flavobacterium sp. TaxID=239 RepID=UPI00286DE64C
MSKQNTRGFSRTDEVIEKSYINNGIAFLFTKNENGDLQTKIVFEGETFEDFVLFDNNNLFLQGFKFNLAQLYNHSFQDFKLDYTVLGMDLSQKTYNNI